MSLPVIFHPSEQLESLADKLGLLYLHPAPEVTQSYLTLAYETGRDLAEAMEAAGMVHQFIITVIESDGQVTYIYPSCVYGGSCGTLEELAVRHPRTAAKVATA